MFNTNWSALPNTVKQNLYAPLMHRSMKHGEWLEFLDNEFAKYHATINAKENNSYADITFANRTRLYVLYFEVVVKIELGCIEFESEQDKMFFIFKFT